MDALLAQVGRPGALRTRGLRAAGYLALVQADAAAAGRLLEAALLAAGRQGDPEAIACACQFLGRAVWFPGEPGRGLALTEDALARHRAAGDWRGTVLTLVQLGIMRALMGDPAAARPPVAAGSRSNQAALRRQPPGRRPRCLLGLDGGLEIEPPAGDRVGSRAYGIGGAGCQDGESDSTVLDSLGGAAQADRKRSASSSAVSGRAV
jgi:hypothetical protein